MNLIFMPSRMSAGDPILLAVTTAAAAAFTIIVGAAAGGSKSQESQRFQAYQPPLPYDSFEWSLDLWEDSFVRAKLR